MAPKPDAAPQHTGGMLALVPDNAEQLAVDDGLPADELHLTLIYFGDDVTAWPPGQAEHLKALVTASGPGLDAVTARIMGHALFNPDGGDDGTKDPCVVYLVSDTPDLAPLHEWATWTATTGENYPTPPPQHTPFIPHITVGTDVGIDELSYTGPVRFGTLRLALGDDVTDVPLGDPEASVGPQIKSITFTPPKAVRDIAEGLDGLYAADVIEGKALDMAGLIWVAGACGPVGMAWAGDMMSRAEVKAAVHEMNMGRVTNDGPRLESIDDLHRAIDEHGNCPAEDRPARVRVLRKHAQRLGAGAHTYSRIDTLEGASTDGSGTKADDYDIELKSWAPGNAAPPSIPHMTALHAAIKAHPKVRQSHKARHKMHLAAEAQRLDASPDVHAQIGYLEPHSFHHELKTLEGDAEFKVTSPSPGATRLRNFWARTAKGRAKWKPGVPGDFKRLRRHLAKYVHNPRILNGLTANIHKLATGEWPGKNAHTAKGNVGKRISYGVKSSFDWEAVEVKDATTMVEPDLAELFDGIDDWGAVFDEPWVAPYLAELEDTDDTPDADLDAQTDAGLVDTARLAALGAKLVVDPAPALADEPEASGDVPDTDGTPAHDDDLAVLFDAPAQVDA